MVAWDPAVAAAAAAAGDGCALGAAIIAAIIAERGVDVALFCWMVDEMYEGFVMIGGGNSDAKGIPVEVDTNGGCAAVAAAPCVVDVAGYCDDADAGTGTDDEETVTGVRFEEIERGEGKDNGAMSGWINEEISMLLLRWLLSHKFIIPPAGAVYSDTTGTCW